MVSTAWTVSSSWKAAAGVLSSSLSLISSPMKLPQKMDQLLAALPTITTWERHMDALVNCPTVPIQCQLCVGKRSVGECLPLSHVFRPNLTKRGALPGLNGCNQVEEFPGIEPTRRATLLVSEQVSSK
jgi:hypothetical protein